jgi:hypothetical protein
LAIAGGRHESKRATILAGTQTHAHSTIDAKKLDNKVTMFLETL